jgi:SOS-response transcriptional repressor LexA
MAAVGSSARRPPTRKQLDTLRFVARYIATQGLSPTLREVMVDAGMTSTNGAYDRLEGLMRRGLLARIHKGAARALTITEAGQRLLAEKGNG